MYNKSEPSESNTFLSVIISPFFTPSLKQDILLNKEKTELFFHVLYDSLPKLETYMSTRQLPVAPVRAALGM
jgi:hypothetical protein